MGCPPPPASLRPWLSSAFISGAVSSFRQLFTQSARKLALNMAIRWHTESRNRHNQSNTDVISNFIVPFLSFSLTLSSSPFISHSICSPPHDHNPSTSIGTESVRKREIYIGGVLIAYWLEHLPYQSEVKTHDEDKPQFDKVINWWQNQQNQYLLVCLLIMCRYICTREYICVPLFLCLYAHEYYLILFLVLQLQSCSLSTIPLPGLGTVQWSSNQMSPTVPVEHQSFATGQDPAAKADLSPTKGREAVVGGEAWAGETLWQESWEGLGGKFTGWTTKAWVTSGT